MVNLWRGFDYIDPGSHFLWDHLSWQLNYRPFLLTLCSYIVSHELLSYHSELRGTRERFKATKRCFHIPLAELVSSPAPNEEVFVERERWECPVKSRDKSYQAETKEYLRRETYPERPHVSVVQLQDVSVHGDGGERRLFP
ncbi:hypothetical protein FQN60_008627 [Etheostoma spectabile]|uniref:Uncharacterized protein n=1 Tax=Etheostoma spectabile TaxID=54343 RepID=A0A5J5CJL7_9PERO|nr:hypothetical protein FQN60_008627 [Etheostoma spectabile]